MHKTEKRQGQSVRVLTMHQITFTFIHLADAFIQSDLQLKNTISDTL